MTKKGSRKLQIIQQLFSEGFDIAEGSIVPFLAGIDDDKEIPQKGTETIHEPPPKMPMEGARYLRKDAAWRAPDYAEDKFFKDWPMEKTIGFLWNRGEEFDDRPAWAKRLDNTKLEEIRKLGDTPEARKSLQEYVTPFLQEKHPWEE